MSLSCGTVFQTALLFMVIVPRLRPGLLSLCSVLASSQTYQQSTKQQSTKQQTTKQQDNKAGWKPIPSVARVTRDEVSGLLKEIEVMLSGRQYQLWYYPLYPINPCSFNLSFFRTRIYQIDTDASIMWRYCLPDSSSLHGYNPETSSQVTLAPLGIGFQPNLPTNNKTTRQQNN